MHAQVIQVYTNVPYNICYAMHLNVGLNRSHPQRCAYVSCLTIAGTEAFHLVDRAILLAKLAELELPENAMNSIVSYLTGHK